MFPGNQHRARIAWFSPLPLDGKHVDSPSAWMTGALLPELRGRFDIELFHDSFAELPGYPTHHYLRAYRRHREQPFDFFVYHLEDHRRTNFARAHLALIPGAVLLHDFFFHDEGPEPLLNSPYDAVLQRYFDQSLSWPARGTVHDRRGRVALREGGFAAVPIFCAERNREEFQRLVRRTLGAGHSHLLHYPAREAQDSWTGREVQRTLLFAGSPRIEDRAHVLLRAISESGELIRLRWLIDQSERQACEVLLKEFEVPEVELINGRSYGSWEELVRSGGVALHLHASVYGDPGPYLSISLMAGLPAVVTNFGAAEFLSERTVYKLQGGETEAGELRELLRHFSRNPRAHDASSVRAAANELYSRKAISSQFAAILAAEQPHLAQVAGNWLALEHAAEQALGGEVLELLGAAGDDQLALAQRKFFAPALRELGLPEDRL